MFKNYEKILFILLIIFLFCNLSLLLENTELFTLKNQSVSLQQFLSKQTDVEYKTELYFSHSELEKLKSKNSNDKIFINCNITEHAKTFRVIKILDIIVGFAIFVLVVLQKRNENNDNFETFLLEKIIFYGLAMYPILYKFAINIFNALDLQITAIVFLFEFFSAFFLYKIFEFITKKSAKSLLLMCLLMFYINNYNNIVLYYNNYFLFMFFVVFAFLINSICIKNFYKSIKFFATVLLIFVISIIIKNCILNQYHQFCVEKTITKTLQVKPQKALKNDIYVIILDAYSSQDVLKKRFGFDNSEFLNELKKRNFSVVQNAKSNYDRTIESIPSFLNMNYISEIPHKSADIAINNAELFILAKSFDYKIYYFNSLDIKNDTTYIDEIVNYSYTSKLETLKLYINSKVFNKIVKYKFKENQFLKLENFIKEHISEPKNKLFFIHVMAPHQPFLYDENGIDIKEEYYENYDLSYIPYLKYTNNQMLKIVDYILQKSSKDVSILILGDHGCRKNITINFKYSLEDRLPQSYINKYLDEQFNILFAIYDKNINIKNYENKESLLNLITQFVNDKFNAKKSFKKDKYFVFSSIFKINNDFENNKKYKNEVTENVLK